MVAQHKTGSIQDRSFRNVLSRLVWVAPLAMLAAAGANLLLYGVAAAIVPAMAAWEGTDPAAIVGATVVYLVLGSLVLALVAWRSARPARHFHIAANIGLLLSLPSPIFAGLGYGPPGVPPAELPVVICLLLMHLLAFAISVPLFLRLVLKPGS